MDSEAPTARDSFLVDFELSGDFDLAIRTVFKLAKDVVEYDLEFSVTIGVEVDTICHVPQVDPHVHQEVRKSSTTLQFDPRGSVPPGEPNQANEPRRKFIRWNICEVF